MGFPVLCVTDFPFAKPHIIHEVHTECLMQLQNADRGGEKGRVLRKSPDMR